ncbi:hypothetical protein [Sinanaerobacter sp. ZZT-01]|uniref:hypothetical protein n=1 Tax=Sinanaerobacter sp. ZZT-01 TaxID=3111540 RepID=UPI002D7695AF|nr:hypothetical protein [Sinanaerobacter sp. ZZT-01]WRR92171.1 hypothetical protein U5921_08805 [Sinanaerobacter sp. ZZT-01]
MTPQEVTTFITFTANIISKDMSAEELDRLADCFSYFATTLYLLSDLVAKQENTDGLDTLNPLDNLNI